jgi:hypothetical protein
MPDRAARPLLFLDVDGTLIPFGASQSASSAPEYEVREGVNPLLSRLDARHGTRLSALPCDLVWATAWMDDANDEIAPLLGLPALPVVDWPDSDEDGPLHWKTRVLVAWADGRPFVWVDDEITDVDRAWVSAHHDGPALLYCVDPGQGLTDNDLAVIDDWLATCQPASGSGP